MFCQVCKKKSASVHYTELSGGRHVEIHICRDCAGKQGVFLSSGAGTGPTAAREKEKKCPACGMSYADFKASGRLGCGGCYKEFAENLSELLRKIHGSLSHSGKGPEGAPGAGAAGLIERHRERMQELVREEKFEEAACLRDIIKKLEQGGPEQL